MFAVQVAWKSIAEDVARGEVASAAEDGATFVAGIEQDLKNMVVAANVVIALKQGTFQCTLSSTAVA